VARLIERWRSECLVVRILVVVAVLAAAQLVEVVIYSFLLPFTG
jgi:phage shock protein PspC (stress-responsive transcriptional regulator)